MGSKKHIARSTLIACGCKALMEARGEVDLMLKALRILRRVGLSFSIDVLLRKVRVPFMVGLVGLFSSPDVDLQTGELPSIAGLMLSVDAVLRILLGVGLIVSSESVLCRVLSIGMAMSIGLALRIGLVALMESSSNSTLLTGLVDGTAIFLHEDFVIAINDGLPSSLNVVCSMDE